MLGQRSLCDSGEEPTKLLRRGLEKVSHFVLENGVVGALFSLDAEMRQGDIVCVFRGSRQPSVVRRCGADYEFVGAASFVGSSSRTVFDEGFFASKGTERFVLI